MKVLSVLNVSNLDDLMCDSGVIFQRIIAERLIQDKGVEYYLIGPDCKQFYEYEIQGVKKLYANLGTTRYSSRFNFNWDYFEKVLKEHKPDVIFNNQVEITSALRSVLTSIEGQNSKLITYCHYPAIWSTNDGFLELDGSLNHRGLALPIVLDVLSAIVNADAFLIQSEFAKGLLREAAKHFNISPLPEIIVIPPPADPTLSISSLDKDIDLRSRTVLYNHRLYESYGTSDFLGFIEDCQDLNFDLIVSDPMPSRSSRRGNLSSTPSLFRNKIAQMPKARVVNGNVERHLYKDVIRQSKVALGAFRKACVWSMAALDCMSLGVPVVAPNYASYPEFIPAEFLFDNLSQAKQILKNLLDNSKYWISSSEKVLESAKKFSARTISNEIYRVFIQ